MGTTKTKSKKAKADAKAKIDAAMDEQRKVVVEQLVQDMMSGKKDWMKPWKSGFAAKNPLSGTVYSGMNRMHLAYTARVRGYSDNRWVTFNQAKKQGWSVRKGEHGTRVEVWKTFRYKVTGDDVEVDDDSSLVSTGYRSYAKRMRVYTVFNLEQIEGAPAFVKPEAETDDSATGAVADMLIESSRCPVSETATDVACYYPGLDSIEVPMRSDFASVADFIATLSHEMTHSTGHPSCLNRSLKGRFGSTDYAFEELIAELGALFITSELGVDGEAAQDGYDNHVAYLQSWAKKVMAGDTVEEATKALFRAASHAEKARAEIMGRYNALAGIESEGAEDEAAA